MAKTPTRETPSATGRTVDGEVIRAFVGSVGHRSDAYESQVRDELAVQGIHDPEPGTWYDLDPYLHVVEALLDSVGSVTLRRVGRGVPAALDLAPATATVADALAALDRCHHGSHRGEAGHYTLSLAGDGRGIVDCRTPYPCALDRGLVEGVLDTHGRSSVADVAESGTCRRDEADACRYELAW
jgi:hypothetical protein